MSIKKQLKREEARKKRIIAVSIFLMLFVPYMVLILNDEGLFTAYEKYFTYGYAAVVDTILLFNIFEIHLESNFKFEITGSRVKIHEGVLKPQLSIQIDKIVYVDVKKESNDFNILVITIKGKRKKGLFELNPEYVRQNRSLSKIYDYLQRVYPGNNFYCYILNKSGARKYYYLYLLYKNAYSAKFSEDAVCYVKSFIEEYNLS
jgi:hypothetical protein